MSQGILIMMISVSLILGAIALGAFLWGIKTRQFEDDKFFNITKFDDEDSLNDAYLMEQKKEELIKRKLLNSDKKELKS